MRCSPDRRSGSAPPGACHRSRSRCGTALVPAPRIPERPRAARLRRRCGACAGGRAPRPRSPPAAALGRRCRWPRSRRPPVTCSAPGGRARLGEQPCQLLRLGDRRSAGEALAHVGGGAAVHRGAALEQRHAVGLAAGEHEVRAERGRARTRSSGSRPGPTERHLLAPGRGGSRAPGAGARTPAGGVAAISCRSRSADSARRSYSCSPVSAPGAAARRRRCELPDGIGLSSRSLRRATSCSWSDEVSKKPPCSSSAKRAIIVSASSRAAANQRGSNVAS